MSVRPVTFQTDGSIDVVYDELGHSGTIPAADIVWASGIDGTPNHDFIVLKCPDGCGATSTHPAGGGAAPLEVQQLFVNKVEHDGCACGQVPPSTNATPAAHVRLNCNRMDGAGRWQLDRPAQHAQAPNMFQVVYRRADRLILGLEPAGGVGPNNGVSVIHDMAEYDVLMRTDPAWLSADGQHIESSAPVLEKGSP